MFNEEWQNRNKYRRYPFIGGTIPDSVIVDAIVGVSQYYNEPWWLSCLDYTPDRVAVTLSCSSSTLIGSTTAKDILLEGEDGWAKITLGSLDDIAYGLYQVHCELEPCRVIKTGAGVSSVNGIKSGNVILSSGSNVSITVNGNTILIDTTDGICACLNTPCIKTINGIPPVNSNFEVQGVGCVEVAPASGGIQISNKCEEACCGCDEVNDIIDLINALAARVTALENAAP